MSRRVDQREFRQTAAIFVVVVAGLWVLQPGSDVTWFGTYASGCIVLSTWFNLKRVPLWFESSALASAFVSLLAWRIVGTPLWAAVTTGVLVQVAFAVSYLR